MLVQSGRPVGVLRTHEWAPRVLIANSNLVGDWATWPEFRRLEELGPDHVRPDDRRLLDLHRHPGHPAGHLRDLRRRRREAVRRHPGRHPDPDRRLRRHGRRPAARRHHERRRLPDRRRRPGPAATAGCEHRYLDVSPTTSTTAVDEGRAGQGRTPGAGRSAWSATAREVFPELLRRGVADRHRHRPDQRPRPAVLPARSGSRSRTGPTTRPGKPEEFTDRARASMAKHVEAMVGVPGRRRRGLRLRQLDPRRGPAGRLRAGVRLPRLRAGLHPAAVLRGQGPVPLGRAVRRPGRHRRHRPGRARPVPGQRPAAAVDARRPASGSPSRACRPGSAGSATASGTRPGCGSTRWSPAASCRAPIVIGRDHLDCGSVASPYRETEAMLDGSDAIADWPLLNALVNTASGASWVSIHHGGGVGIGRSIHAGQVTVADGTELAAQKIDRVLTNDPGMGVIRHVDAGYDRGRRGRRRARRPGPDARGLRWTTFGPRSRSATLWAVAAPHRPRRPAPAATAGTPGPRRTPSLRDWFAGAGRRRADSTWSRTGTATCGPGGATRTPTGRWSPDPPRLGAGRRRLRRAARRRLRLRGPRRAARARGPPGPADRRGHLRRRGGRPVRRRLRRVPADHRRARRRPGAGR